MSRLAALQKLITRQDILKELKQIKKEILETPDLSVSDKKATKENSESSPPTQSIQDKNIIENLVKYLHKEKKLTLVSALEKVESWELKGKELHLLFNTRNKFSGELLKKEKSVLTQILSKAFSLCVKILISFNKVEQHDQEQKDQRVEILKNVFQGEVIKEE